MQDQAAQQVVEALKKANNVMVTVKNSPSVDDLTAAVGLTLMLNHMNKHATTVFGGRIPSTIEFLQPEMAIETNTDSLRDFIISLDKSKADKLRYKVENDVVRIFITPYKTSITDQDLQFSQGDFNVDVVIALGVVSQEDFDQAVNTHGRILHNATIIGVTKQNAASQVGAVNWYDPQASSISEMIASITEQLGPNLLDGQIATSLMTGMVAETDRFRNSNTTPRVLSLSAKLMAAGANQQLIAEKLEEPSQPPQQMPKPQENNEEMSANGMLEIAHEDEGEEIQKIQIDDHGNISNGASLPANKSNVSEALQKQIVASPQANLESTDPIQEGNVMEEPPREYISTEAQASPDEEQKSTEINTIPSNSLGAMQRNDKIFQHDGEKVIEPIENQGVEGTVPEVPIPTNTDELPLPPTPKENVVADNNAGHLGTPPTPVDVKPTEPIDTKNDTKQTLTDIESAVHDVPDNNDKIPDLEDYSGSTRKPAKTKDAKSDLPLPPVLPKPNTPVIIEPGSKNSSAHNTKAPPTAPAVPPPIMPAPNTQPQFFEADGSKGNPFLNPPPNSTLQ